MTKSTQHFSGSFVRDEDVRPVGSILYRRGGNDPWRQFDRDLFAAEHTLGCCPVEDSGIVVLLGEDRSFEVLVSGEFPRDGVQGDLDGAVQAGLLNGIEFITSISSTPAEESVPVATTEESAVVTVDGDEVGDEIVEAPVGDHD